MTWGAALLAHVLVILLPLSCAAQVENWTSGDKALFATSTALLIVDWGQTRYIAKNTDRFQELNPILGRHPSVGRVNTYFATAIIGNYLIADWIGPKNRKLYLGGITVLESVVVIRNNGIGIKVDF